MFPFSLCYHWEDKHKRNAFIKHERNNKIKASNYKDVHARKQSNSITSTIITIVINIITTVQRLKCNLYNLQELSLLIMSIFILILFFIMNLLT
jgi:hypothetical protein